MTVPKIHIMGSGHTAATIGVGFIDLGYQMAELEEADFIFISLDIEDSSKLDFIFAVAAEAGQCKSANAILCLTSQVPVGTSEKLSKVAQCNVVYIPEFLRMGNSVHSFRYADRVVIGSDNRKQANQVARLYDSMGVHVYLTDLRTAEMSKHASNAFLATSISFINEIADLCQRTGANIIDVANIMKLDHRIGQEAYLTSGEGFTNGHLEREVRTLQNLGRDYHYKTKLMDAVMAVNQDRK